MDARTKLLKACRSVLEQIQPHVRVTRPARLFLRSDLVKVIEVAEREEKTSTSIVIGEPSGLAPLQIEGFINGKPFYYRDRHGRVDFTVGSDPQQHALDSDPLWHAVEPSPQASVPDFPDHGDALVLCAALCAKFAGIKL